MLLSQKLSNVFWNVVALVVFGTLLGGAFYYWRVSSWFAGKLAWVADIAIPAGSIVLVVVVLPLLALIAWALNKKYGG